MLLDRNIDDFNWGTGIRRLYRPVFTDNLPDTQTAPVQASALPATTTVAVDPAASSPVTAVSGSITVPSPNSTGFIPDFSSSIDFTVLWDRLVTAVESHWIALGIVLALIWLDRGAGKKKK